MRVRSRLFPLLLLSVSALGQSTPSLMPQAVEFPSGKLRLKAYLWKPAGAGPFPAILFNHGSGGEDADHTAGMPITQSAYVLAPFSLNTDMRSFTPFAVAMVHPPAKHHSCRICCIVRRWRKGKRPVNIYSLSCLQPN